MRRLALTLLVVAGGCKPGGVSQEQQLCAKAAAMFERCEQLSTEGSAARLERELVVDRWRGLCRAVITGKTEQLLPDALALFQSMNDDVKLALREQAECTAQATTCAAYAACTN